MGVWAVNDMNEVYTSYTSYLAQAGWSVSSGKLKLENQNLEKPEKGKMEIGWKRIGGLLKQIIINGTSDENYVSLLELPTSANPIQDEANECPEDGTLALTQTSIPTTKKSKSKSKMRKSKSRKKSKKIKNENSD